jgi:flagellar basal body-associated protein FliL
MVALITLLAQGTERTQEAPSTGPGIALIIGAVLLALLLFALVFYVFAHTTSASHGGVEPAPGTRTSKGEPPFESFEREVEVPREP